MKTKTLFAVIIGFFILSTVQGCQYLKKRVEKKEKTEYTLNSKGKTKIEINNTYGNVNVVSVNDTLGRISIIAEKTGEVRINETDKPIEGINILIDSAGDVIVINTEYKTIHALFGHDHNSKVNYTIKVPASLNVHVDLTNGTITADGLNGDTHLENVNGPIYIGNCRGLMKAETVNGLIKANVDSTRSFFAETVNGSIAIGDLKNANSRIEASCIHGKVKYENLSFTTLNTEKNSLSGKLGSGTSEINLSTVNGKISLDGNYINYNKSNDNDFNIKFDFDDDNEDHPVKIEINKTEQERGVGILPKDSLKAKDSVKTK